MGDKPHQKQPTGDVRAFLEVLKEFMADLAKLVVRDGEGATKFVTVRVRSEIGYTEAKSAATSIATSSLVKTALYGKDANWGRILCAIGYANDIMPGTTRLPRDPQEREKTNAQLKAIPSQTSVSFVPADGSPELKLLVRGEPETVDEERAKQILEMEDLEILVDMCDRDLEPGIPPPVVREATVWTCDFSHEYVTINGNTEPPDEQIYSVALVDIGSQATIGLKQLHYPVNPTLRALADRWPRSSVVQTCM